MVHKSVEICQLISLPCNGTRILLQYLQPVGQIFIIIIIIIKRGRKCTAERE